MTRHLAPLFALSLLAGCVVHTGPGGQSEPVVSLGPSAAPGYHVLANGSTVIPGGDIGYAFTANGGGGYQVSFTDTLGSASVFSGSLTTDGTFSQLLVTGEVAIQQTAPNELDFSGVPGSTLFSFSAVSSTDPVYLSANIDGSGSDVAIYFTGASTALVQTAAFNPVAFTSP